MALLDLLGISKAYESQKILENIDFFINKGERICIIGRNGGGKSTLMKILDNSIDFDAGRRICSKDIKVEMLDQTPSFSANLSVKDAIESQLGELKDAKERYEQLVEQLCDSSDNKELQTLTDFLDAHNAWSLDDRIERILLEFNLKEFEHSPVDMLSGGEQRRVTLAGLILKKPDILLLDEPTNHLDVYMVEFLESMLLSEKFTLVFISHDRYFIDNIATRTVEIDECALRHFQGGYADYLEQKEVLLMNMQTQHEHLLKNLKNEENWLRRGVKARLKRNEGRKQRVLALREDAKKNPALISKIKLELEREQKNFNQEKSINKQKMLFEMYDIHKTLGDKELITSFSTRIIQKDRIAIVGKNGAGKSTLLKILLQEIPIDRGTLKIGEFKIGYFDQQRVMLDDERNILETFCPNSGDRVDVRGSSMHVYGYLKNFLFPKENLGKKIGVLSGGEKNRVALALLFTKEVDCLIFDEPTNDLDIPTINILEEYIDSFQGAVIFVSHDRYFVDKIAKKLFIFEGNGVIRESYQEYSEYLSIEKELKEIDALREMPTKEPKQNNYKNSSNSLKLSYKEKQDYQNLPIQIEQTENTIKQIKECLENPDCYRQKGLANLSKELEEQESLLEPLIERYLELEEKIELM